MNASLPCVHNTWASRPPNTLIWLPTTRRTVLPSLSSLSWVQLNVKADTVTMKSDHDGSDDMLKKVSPSHFGDAIYHPLYFLLNLCLHILYIHFCSFSYITWCSREELPQIYNMLLQKKFNLQIWSCLGICVFVRTDIWLLNNKIDYRNYFCGNILHNKKLLSWQAY